MKTSYAPGTLGAMSKGGIFMNVWRLIGHHEEPDFAIEMMKKSNRIAIGWSEIGDLRKVKPKAASDITSIISEFYSDLNNAHLGGPSLWNLYHEMKIGDYVIINSYSKKCCVFEITGPYIYESGNKQIVGYGHQRPAVLTGINPDELWEEIGSNIGEGQNIRWTLVSCKTTKIAEEIIYREGQRYSIPSTVIERNPDARAKCLAHYGYQCTVCGFDFKAVYGDIGDNFIHVHHRVDISTKDGEYIVDPIKDLVPICPNCHAMVHKVKPSMEIEKLMMIINENKNV